MTLKILLRDRFKLHGSWTGINNGEVHVYQVNVNLPEERNENVKYETVLNFQIYDIKKAPEEVIHRAQLDKPSYMDFIMGILQTEVNYRKSAAVVKITLGN